MKILIHDTAEAAEKDTARRLAQAVNKKPDSVLGLATGGTMTRVYEELVALYNKKRVSFSEATTFNLDEYIGLPAEHPCSYHTYMREALFKHIDIPEAATHLPDGMASDPDQAAADYEAAIHAAGGIDLQLLGIGHNGHIGFNEPSSSLQSRTRVKTLTEDTRRANQRYFASFDETPIYAITMGIATIMDARECLLLATGAGKADAVAAMIEGPMSANCPASALQMHQTATILLDSEAASRLANRAYYEYVHPKGDDSVQL